MSLNFFVTDSWLLPVRCGKGAQPDARFRFKSSKADLVLCKLRLMLGTMASAHQQKDGLLFGCLAKLRFADLSKEEAWDSISAVAVHEFLNFGWSSTTKARKAVKRH